VALPLFYHKNDITINKKRKKKRLQSHLKKVCRRSTSSTFREP